MTLSDAAPAPAPVDRKPRRRAAAIAGVVGVASVVGAGAWAWQFWSAQGPQPAEALPSDTLAYVAIDLDPPGGQKVAAYDTLRKFPTLKKDLHLGSQDDLRRSLVDTVTQDSGCDLDFDDIAPWAGDRAALAVVPLKKPELVAVVQVKDGDDAEAGLKKIARDCADDEFGFALGDGWAVLARTTSVARQVQADGERSALADDADYKELTGAAGDAGVMTMFAAPAAGQALLDAAEEDPFIGFFALMPLSGVDPVATLVSFSTFLTFPDESFGGEMSSDDMPPMSPEEKKLHQRLEHMEDLTQAEQDQLFKELDAFYEKQAEEGGYAIEDDGEAGGEFDEPEIPAEIKKALAGFSGAGGVARFDNGALEVEIVGDPAIGGLEGRYDGTDGRATVAALPEDTAVAFGGGFADGWAERAVTESNPFGFGQSKKEVLAAFKKATGLSPADLEELGGDSVAFVAKSGFTKHFDADASEVPVAAVLHGDVAEIDAALAKLRATLDPDVRDFVQSLHTDHGVAVGPSKDYLEELADPKATLGDTDRFRDAVPDGEKAITVTFADFDAGGWVEFLTESDLDARDVKPLDTAAMTVTQDGDRHRYLLRVNLD